MIYAYIRDMAKLKGVIFELARRDYQQQNQGSYLGFVWNYLQPIFYIGVLYTIITMGFRHDIDQSGMPYSLYLLSGMTCWLYFAANLSSITGVIRTYGFLVKKVDFRLSVLPIVKLLSSLPPHLALVAMMFALGWMTGLRPGLHNLQIIYYYICMAAMLAGVGWITSSTTLFVRDISNAIAIAVQFGMWLTPIFWSVQQLPPEHQWIARLNPVWYLVNGYRDSLTGAHFFWQYPLESLTFWSFCLSSLIAGAIIYRRLKPHFAEVI